MLWWILVGMKEGVSRSEEGVLEMMLAWMGLGAV